MTQTETFTIQRRPAWTFMGAISVTIECDPLASIPIKLGLAVRAAIKESADLTSADLTSADLTSANLRYANLTSANLFGEKVERLIASAQRSDGYTFFGLQMQAGGVKIMAGCRWFTPAEFRAHVASQYPDTDKAKETGRILDLIEGRADDLGIKAPAKVKTPRAKKAA
ncbi:pentapeptide repeat-containing protein [Devosia sp.]|uniref:pentapeptide repeat-containing protein n=1 Tax=Devosia sp. TaxID=1871048 RepID=UPI002FC9C246